MNQKGLSEVSVLSLYLMHLCFTSSMQELYCVQLCLCCQQFSANPAAQYEDAEIIYTFVSSPSRRPMRSMFLSMVARHVISFAHSMGNHPLSPSRSRSPSYQPAQREQRVRTLLKDFEGHCGSTSQLCTCAVTNPVPDEVPSSTFLDNSISCLWLFHMSKPPNPYRPQLFISVGYDRDELLIASAA